ncbi:MAG: META domain-containing protein [Anaerolineaceae bacterium]|nr:META domain-containing protein [Anaerolineaceae bacterium]
MNVRKIFGVLLLLTFTLAACGPQPVIETPAPPQEIQPPTAAPTEEPTIVPLQIDLNKLENTTYQGIYEEAVPLTDGVYEGEPVTEGSALRPLVTLIPEIVAFGDLNGDGVEDAVVVLTENSGGSGSFVYLAAVVNDMGVLKNIATLLLGDRVFPSQITIADQQIVVEMLTHSDSDPLCCPSLEVRNTYALKWTLEKMDSETLSEVVMPDSLQNTKWVASGIFVDGEMTTNPLDSKITAQFEDGRISGQSACNQYSADYTLEENNSINFSASMSTLMACEPAVNQREQEFLTALQAVTRYRMDENTLELLDANGDVQIAWQTRAEAAVPAELLNTVWRWTAYEDTAGLNDITVPDPSKYTLEFQADGSVLIQADCNRATGSVNIENGSLNYIPGLTTLAACGPDSLYDQFLAKLNDSATYVLQDGQLFLNLKMDAGNMVFAP